MAKKRGKRDRVGTPSRSSVASPSSQEEEVASPSKPPDPKRLNYGDADLMNVEDGTGENAAAAAAVVVDEVATAAAAAAAATKAAKDAAAAKAAAAKAAEEAASQKKAARKETPQERKQRLALQKEIGQKIPVGGLKDYLAAQEDNDEEMEELPRPAPKRRGPRGRSLDSQQDKRSASKKAASRRSQSRGSSVDSTFTRKSGKGEDSDESEEDESSKGRRKSTSFQEGTLNNEGKTASTKKVAREKKKESYANKASLPPKKTWVYQRVVNYVLRVGAVKSTCGEVYKRVADAFAVLQQYDPTVAIQDADNPKADPIRSLGEWPKVGQHGRWQRFFKTDGELKWTWDDNIKADKPRTFVGNFILLSDKDPEEIFNYCRVDLRTTVKGEFSIKEIQELHTTIGFCLLGVHANVDGPNVIHDLRKYLIQTEKDLFEEVREWKEEDGFFDPRFEDFDEKWQHMDFPELSSWRGFPKGGIFEQGKGDVSWKLAIHVCYATADHDRVMANVNEFKRNKGVLRLFGEEALLEEVIQDYRDVGGREDFIAQIPKHQNINRSVGSAVLQGFVNIDASVAMYFEPPREGKVRIPKEMNIRDVLRKLYIKIGGRKFSVFVYCFKNFRGQYQIWFWDKFPDMRQFTAETLRILPAHIWHSMRRWGWDLGCCRCLMNLAFDSETATNAMNSKFNPTTKKVVLLSVNTQAAAHAAFGQSPFILEPGEEMKTPKPTKKIQVKRSQLGPEDMGGMDFDDLHSVGAQSNTETVAVDDDDVSEWDENEGFEDQEGIEEVGDEDRSKGESTYAGMDEEDGEYEEEEEDDRKMPAEMDDDSAFETKGSAYSAKSGSTANFYKGEIARLQEENAEVIAQIQAENAANMRAMVEQMEAMQKAFQAMRSPVSSPVRNEVNVDKGPEAGAGGSSGNSNSLNGPNGSAPADAK
jgi:hypothetical protein